jgi:hypothetical protein
MSPDPVLFGRIHAVHHPTMKPAHKIEGDIERQLFDRSPDFITACFATAGQKL